MIATAEQLPRTRTTPAGREFWWRHTRIPLIALFAVTVATGFSSLDESLAHWLFFDESRSQWLGARNWWVNAFLHEGGRWFIRGVVTASLLLWIATFIQPRWRRVRRPSLYFTVAMILSIAAAGLLKTVTNVDCPWDLREFGGQFPFVHLFADRPDGLRHAHCFPAAHASSGYALMSLYFVAYERGRQLARSGLAIGSAVGLMFGIAQQSRGAHFFSHDVWSACIVWLVALAVYGLVFKGRAWDDGSSF